MSLNNLKTTARMTSKKLTNGQLKTEKSLISVMQTLLPSKAELLQRLNSTRDLKRPMPIAMTFLALMSGTSSLKVTKLEERQEEKSSRKKTTILWRSSGLFATRLNLKRKAKNKVCQWLKLKQHSCIADNSS